MVPDDPSACCCCCFPFRACFSLAGFAQFGISVVLLVAASGPGLLNPHGQCALGSSAHAESLCGMVGVLAALTIFSGLILAVTQSLMSVWFQVFCGRGSCAEALGRAAMSVGWLITSILVTIAAVKDHRHSPDPHWLWTTVALTWSMFLLSLIMTIFALISSAFSCFTPESLQQQPCLVLCAEALCLAWLLRKLTGKDAGYAPTEGYSLYTPVPGGPSHGPPSLQPSHSRRQRYSPPGYHEHFMHAHVPVTVVHPLAEPSHTSFFGPMARPPPMQHAPPVHPSFQPTMPSAFGHGAPAMGVPVGMPPPAAYPEIYPPSQPQAPLPECLKAEQPSAPPLPSGKS